MPDSEGRLTDQERTKINQWLTDRWKTSVLCPICHENHWSIGRHIVTTLRMTSQGTMLGGESYPQVLVICHTSGYTAFVNAVIMGLMPATEKSDGK